jgi:hypothetical protein
VLSERDNSALGVAVEEFNRAVVQRACVEAEPSAHTKRPSSKK